MDIALEFHGYWNLPSAIQIAQAVKPYSPMWLEEMVPQDNLAVYKELSATTDLPLCLSERLMTRYGFRELGLMMVTAGFMVGVITDLIVTYGGG